MIQRVLILVAIFMLAGCQSNLKPFFAYDEKKNQLVFQIDNSLELQLPARSFFYQPRSSQKTIRAYTLLDEINAITIEHVQLPNDAEWHGLPRSLYENFFKERLQIRTLEVIYQEEFGNYEFRTYKVNNKYVLNLVYIWETNQHTFIYDAKGLLFHKLLKKFKPDFIEKNELPNYGKSFKDSVVFFNSTYRFFK